MKCSGGTYTVKLTLAKLPANAGDFTCRLHVKKPHAQFKCVTCSFLVKTGKFTGVYAASTSRRIPANCLQPHSNLPKNSGYFTGNLTCRTHVSLPTTGMQNCMLLQAKNPQLQVKIPRNVGKNTENCRRKNPHLHAKCYHMAAKFICKVTHNLRASLNVVTWILHEVLAPQAKCVWGLFTCIIPRVKSPAFAGNATMPKNYHLLQASYNARHTYIGSTFASSCQSSSTDIKNPIVEK